MSAIAQAYLKVRYTLELVKFSHSVFALPFALASFLIETGGRFSVGLLLWVVLAVVAARTAAMAFNRLADARFDAENPRTKNRHIPRNLLSKTYVMLLTLAASAGFVFCAWKINALAFALATPCLLLLFLYSLAKRFTDYTQLVLGFCLGMAPVGAAVAAVGRITPGSLILGMGVLLWVAGFDLLYALQDLEFDRRQGLRSLPAKLGPKKTLVLAAGLHALFLGFLAAYGLYQGLGWIYWAGLAVSAGFLLWQHWLIQEGLHRINAAFFTANGLLSLLFLLFVTLDLYF